MCPLSARRWLPEMETAPNLLWGTDRRSWLIISRAARAMASRAFASVASPAAFGIENLARPSTDGISQED